MRPLCVPQWRIFCNRFRETRPVDSEVYTRNIDNHTQNTVTSNPYFWLFTNLCRSPASIALEIPLSNTSVFLTLDSLYKLPDEAYG